MENGEKKFSPVLPPPDSDKAPEEGQERTGEKVMQAPPMLNVEPNGAATGSEPGEANEVRRGSNGVSERCRSPASEVASAVASQNEVQPPQAEQSSLAPQVVGLPGALNAEAKPTEPPRQGCSSSASASGSLLQISETEAGGGAPEAARSYAVPEAPCVSGSASFPGPRKSGSGHRASTSSILSGVDPAHARHVRSSPAQGTGLHEAMGSSALQDNSAAGLASRKNLRRGTTNNTVALEAVKAWQERAERAGQNDHAKGRRLTARVIHPDRTFRLTWDLCGLVAILYQAVSVPYELTFISDTVGAEKACVDDAGSAACVWASVNLAMDFFFGLDIIFNFFTGFYNKGTLVLNLRACMVNYFRTWFAIDVMAIFPWRFINSGEEETEATSSDTDATKLLRMLKFLKFVRILKLLRVMKLRRVMMKLEDHLRSEYLYVVVQLVKLGMSLLLLCHVCACVWYGVGISFADHEAQESGRFSSWIEKNGLDRPDVQNIELYVAALYFTMATMTTVGYGDVVPVSNAERVFGIFLLLGGTGVFAMLVSSIAAAFRTPSANNATSAGPGMERGALQYLWKKGVSGELTVRIRKYLQQHQESKADVEAEEYLRTHISSSLRHEFCVGGFLPLICWFDFFKDCSATLAGEVCCICHRIYSPPGEILFAEGDPADAMYFIVTGKVAVLRRNRDPDDPVPELRHGQYLGEAALFAADATRQASIVCAVFCEFVQILREEFLDLSERNEELLEKISDRRRQTIMTARRMSRLMGDRNNQTQALSSRVHAQCSICKRMGHYPSECRIKQRWDNPELSFILGTSREELRPWYHRMLAKLPFPLPFGLDKLQRYYGKRRRRMQIMCQKDAASSAPRGSTDGAVPMDTGYSTTEAVADLQDYDDDEEDEDYVSDEEPPAEARCVD